MPFVKEEQEFGFGYWDGADPAPVMAALPSSAFLYQHATSPGLYAIVIGSGAGNPTPPPTGNNPALGLRSTASGSSARPSPCWIGLNPDWFDDRTQERFLLVDDDNGVPAGYDPA